MADNEILELSEITVNDYNFKIADNDARSDIDDITAAILANNTSIGTRINNLNDRSFDALIKISSNNESEIASIQDGIYKIKYVTITVVNEEETESLNNSAILIQKNNTQYLYKDGHINYREYDTENEEWPNWENNDELPNNYEASSLSNANLEPEAGDTIIEAISKLHKAMLDDEEIFAYALTDLNSRLEDSATKEYVQEILSDLEGGEGVIGPQGPQGASGPQGTTGETGPQGTQGETGSQGAQGEGGPQGAQGEAGSQGETGPQGTQGEIGPQGTQGETGPQGTQGEIGPQGTQGEIGPQGTQGEIGPQGAQGEQGPQGAQGAAAEGSGLPSVTSADNGKILMVVNGVWTLVSPTILYSGSGTPNNSQGNNGDIYVQTNE